MPTRLDKSFTHWYRFISDDGVNRLILTGDFTLVTLGKQLQTLIIDLGNYADDPDLYWDLTEIKQMDAAGVILLWRAWNSQRPMHILLRPEQEKMFERLEKQAASFDKPKSHDLLWPIMISGRIALLLWEHLIGIVILIGQLLLSAKLLIKYPRYIPWREISANLYRTGAQALGITALVGFLIGIVLSYLSSKQLQMFGADIFIINILGISIIRELGPLLAAILVAGRSGSSMTAQLGVMRVTEELDALTVMGISHSQRLVLPKVLGLGIAMPLLVLWTSAVALMGGIVAAELQLGLSYQYFLTALPDAVPTANLWLGLGKGAVCGMVIALIACHFGLRIKPNTESLGEGTTNSVVTAITVVIIIDAIFAIVFSDVGLL
ncbi:phospholipid/cholesterol/gamma-HCH transport system permease protein [Nitrosomonas cryotolerans]|uniref:Phospholipid/cholesterol/gamma-HCH transport system permease protein n=1 Tax=Nitrosomonas cryotolerans ATCC 49181 TaxID=1131553 RepID=A0A1N6INQ4_9PROT|nr:ABC transporter permease [Nitrosomonas cryotolerans]SFP35935.1 phospholipid/cholesterol/gamma-HCH transport system permease protein [Nitrosomonas cryotolerans]SIO33574.1 phospholipid/cholesterol/gamma-HCH transport system permease protein [Nitrosomonas cryotolerans ATCC 49181]